MNMSQKIEELLGAMRLGEIMHRRQHDDKKHRIVCILAIIGAIATVAGIAYAVYRYLNPDYLDDFDEDFDDYEDEFEDFHFSSYDRQEADKDTTVTNTDTSSSLSE